jgi:hypothetical protein
MVVDTSRITALSDFADLPIERIRARVPELERSLRRLGVERAGP